MPTPISLPSLSLSLHAYLIIAAALFCFGLYSCLARRNAIGILIGVELLLNACVLNLMAFWRFGSTALDGDPSPVGPLFGLFVIIIAACEAAVALAILLNLYFNFNTIDVDRASELKG